MRALFFSPLHRCSLSETHYSGHPQPPCLPFGRDGDSPGSYNTCIISIIPHNVYFWDGRTLEPAGNSSHWSNCKEISYIGIDKCIFCLKYGFTFCLKTNLTFKRSYKLVSGIDKQASESTVWWNSGETETHTFSRLTSASTIWWTACLGRVALCSRNADKDSLSRRKSFNLKPE